MKKNILFVDNDALTLKEYEELLISTGKFDVDISTSIKNAIVKLTQKEYLVVILKMNFPDNIEKGLILLKHISDTNSYTKVIVLTDHPSIENILSCLDLGICGYFEKSKPDTTGKLLSTVIKLLADTFVVKINEQDHQLIAPLGKIVKTDHSGVLSHALHFFHSVKTKKINQIFIAHGPASFWEKIYRYVKEDLNYKVEAFESESRISEPITYICDNFLKTCNCAIAVIAKEDFDDNGQARTRQNVIHEIGLFQGKYGTERVIIFEEEGVDIYSNISGLQTIKFRKNPEEGFYKLEKALKKIEQ